jgi:hypothetical protein
MSDWTVQQLMFEGLQFPDAKEIAANLARLAEAERVLRTCAAYLADKNAGKVGRFNATAQALEDYFGEPSLRSIADTSGAAP